MTLVDAFEATDKVIEWFLPMLGKDIDPRFTYTEDDLAFIERGPVLEATDHLWRPFRQLQTR
jgi:hypothetical protein